MSFCKKKRLVIQYQDARFYNEKYSADNYRRLLLLNINWAGALGKWLALAATLRGSFPGLGGLKETKMFFPYPLVKLSILGCLRDREVACSASDIRSVNFPSCAWRAPISPSSGRSPCLI